MKRCSHPSHFGFIAGSGFIWRSCREMLLVSTSVALASFLAPAYAASPQDTPSVKSKQSNTQSAKKSDASSTAQVSARTASVNDQIGFGANSASSVQASQVEDIQINSKHHASGTTPGGGMMPAQVAPKSRSGLTRDFIAKQSSTSNPVSMIASLPGVVYAGNDPLGANDDQQGMSVRGLDQTEIGYLYEGIPAAPPLFLMPYTGQTADNENIQKLTLSQGSPDISTATYNAVGGELVETLREPSHHRGGLVSGTWGSYRTNREFIRLDTGDIGKTGVRGFVSFSYRSNDQWRGSGGDTRFHVDSKFVKDWGEASKTSLVFSYNRSRGYYYRQPTKAQWEEYGKDFNYTSTYSPGNANYYKFYENARRQFIIGAPSEFALSDSIKWSIVPWLVQVRGYDDYGTNISRTGSYYGNTPAGTLSVPSNNPNGDTITGTAIDLYKQWNPGVNTSFTWTKGQNNLTLGYWYSYFTYSGPSYYAAADDGGGIPSMVGQYPIKTESGHDLQAYNMHLVQNAHAVYLGDTFSAFNNKLTISGGVKGVFLNRYVTNQLPGARYKNGQSDAQPLPQFLVSYKISPHDQIYVNGTASFRAPSGISSYTDRFSISTGKQTRSAASDNLKSEYAIGEEIGYRHTGRVNISAALFNYNFTNRQITTTGVYNGAYVTETVNGGGQTARGAQLEVGLSPWHHFSPYVSGQYLHATIDNNLKSGSDYLPTAGKRAVKSPAYTAAVGISYDDGHIFGMFNFNYVGSQYTTFMNDEKIPAYETFNISAGYRFSDKKFLKSPQIQLNLINIGGNKGYLSGVSGVSANAKATRGINGTMIAGSAPTYFVGGGFAALVSTTVGF